MSPGRLSNGNGLPGTTVLVRLNLASEKGMEN
jgi:hypothetical protein